MVTPLAAGLAAVAAALAVAPLGRRPPFMGHRPRTPGPGRGPGNRDRPGRLRSARGRADASHPGRPATRLRGAALVGGAGFIGFAVAGPVAGILAGVLLVAGRRSRRRAAARAQADRLDELAAEVLMAFAAEVAAGLAPAPALEAAIGTTIADAEPALAGIRTALRADADPVPALTATGIPTLADLAAAWVVCHTDGLRIGPVAERLAEVARGEAARSAELRGALAGPRASGNLLAVLPLAGIGLAALAGGSPVHFLLRTPVGGAFTFAGVGLELAGLAWLTRMADRTRGAARPLEPPDDRDGRFHRDDGAGIPDRDPPHGRPPDADHPGDPGLDPSAGAPTPATVRRAVPRTGPPTIPAPRRPR